MRVQQEMTLNLWTALAVLHSLIIAVFVWKKFSITVILLLIAVFPVAVGLHAIMTKRYRPSYFYYVQGRSAVQQGIAMVAVGLAILVAALLMH